MEILKMRIITFVWVGALLLSLLAGCSTNPYAKTNRIHKKQARVYARELKTFPQRHVDDTLLNYGPYPVGTTNFSLRKPNYVILHHTAQNSVEHTLKTFTLRRTSVSSHYVIGSDGEIFQMLNDYYRGWHAGVGKWGNNTDLNSSSIGIELDNNGHEAFSEAQIESLIKLLKVLKERYGIPTANFIGHSDIAPRRKVDPNSTFPWKRLAEEGFGYWYDEQPQEQEMIADSLLISEATSRLKMELAEKPDRDINSDSLHLRIDPKVALRIIGYDVRDLDAAIKAFKLHFIQDEINTELTDEDLEILYNLYLKYL
jgi:N-acetylmuramoyl-L-alanine amidase